MASDLTTLSPSRLINQHLSDPWKQQSMIRQPTGGAWSGYSPRRSRPPPRGCPAVLRAGTIPGQVRPVREGSPWRRGESCAWRCCKGIPSLEQPKVGLDLLQQAAPPPGLGHRVSAASSPAQPAAACRALHPLRGPLQRRGRRAAANQRNGAGPGQV